MRPREDGVAVVMALGLMALLMLLAYLGGGAVALFAAHRQVQTAADLAALAGANALQSGGAPCEVAHQVAVRNGGELLHCVVQDSTILLVVERPVPALLGGRKVHARARAGPVEALGPVTNPAVIDFTQYRA